MKYTGTQNETLLNDIHSSQSSITGNQKANKNNDKDKTSKTKQPKDEEMKENEHHCRSPSPEGLTKKTVPILPKR